jgi:hypothetical protein
MTLALERLGQGRAQLLGPWIFHHSKIIPELNFLRGVFERLGQSTNFINETELECGPTRPHAPLRYFLNHAAI